MTGPGDRPIRVARIIARLNIGGPAIQAITLTERLAPLGYETLLIRGTEASHEGSMDHLAEELGVQPLRLVRMGRELGPGDLVAFVQLVRALRRFRPDVVHTHAAKAGTLGRLATLVPGRGRRPVTVHTFHGHSLTGYFGPRKAALFLRVERFLAKRTTCLIAVSEEVRNDLVRLGVAPRERFDVIHLGLDLDRFDVAGPQRSDQAAALRAELDIPADAKVVTLIARLVPIKRVDRFLAVAHALAAQRDDVWFLIVGDGWLRERLQATPPPRTVWAGFRRDVPAVCFASDVVVLTSDNEGTPVSLIEAQAAGVPVVSTRVGGAAAVVAPGGGTLVDDADDIPRFAAAVAAALDGAGPADDRRAHVMSTFSLGRLVSDIDGLYRRLLARSPGTPPRPPAGLLREDAQELRCVACGDALALESSSALACCGCPARYAIAGGVPRMLDPIARPAQEAAVAQRTADSFAYEWEHFGAMRDEWAKNFADYLQPHTPQSLAGKRVLDVGAGSGRHSFHAAQAGARVVAVDLGASIEVARRNLPASVLAVQADAEALPFEPGSFDLVMSIGVLHHLPDTERGLRSIARYAKPGGHVHIYLYWVPEQRWQRAVLRAVGAVRRVTVRLPHPVLHAVCYPLAALLLVAFVIPYRALRTRPAAARLAAALPLKTYADYPFGVLVNDQFDRFSAPLERRFTEREVRAAMEAAGLENVIVLANHGWVADGQRPPHDAAGVP